MKKNGNIVFICILLLFVAISFGTFTYSNSISEGLTASTLSTLSESASQQQLNFDDALNSELDMLESISNTLVIFGYNEQTILDYLTSLEDFHRFSDLSVVDYNGVGIMKDGTIINISESDYFKEAFMGNQFISEPMISEYSNKPVIVLSAPIIEYGEIVGVVSAEYNLQLLSEILLPTFNGQGTTIVFSQDGVVVASTDPSHLGNITNLFSSGESAVFSNESEEFTYQEDILSGGSGTLDYYMADLHRIAEYRPTSHNNWVVLLGVPSEVILGEADSISTGVTIFNIFVILVSAILLFVILLIRRNSMRGIEKAAYYDDLTGLRNLVKFKIDATELLVKNPETIFSIIKLDVINFKVINEIFSFEVGNQLICAMADVSREISYTPFICARVGTDEFLIISIEKFGKDFDGNIPVFTEMFRKKVPNIAKHNIDFRHGRYYTELGETDINSIIDKVTLAHSFSKAHKTAEICDYNDQFRLRILKTAEITNKMEKAMENREFKVYLQPKYRLTDNKMVGAEALVRWIEDDGNMIYPNDFIPIFEQNGFIVNLDKYMLKSVCEVVRGWIDNGRTPVPVSVNFSRLHLENPSFVEEITAITDEANVPRDSIEIELTESTIIDNEETLVSVLEQLHANGFKLSMDDFGTGYSSLGMLKNLNVDVIKLDRSFFDNLKSEDRGKKVVESMVDMAQRLDIETVAEGVETPEHVEFLKSIDCEIGQGYFYAKPMPALEL